MFLKVIPPQPPIHVVPKVSTRASNKSFSIVFQMKKIDVNISMLDIVATIPMQKRRLQQELESIKSKDQLPSMETCTTFVQP